MHLNLFAFVDSLRYMGVGMLCIMLVIGAMIGVTLLLQKLTK